MFEAEHGVKLLKQSADTQHHLQLQIQLMEDSDSVRVGVRAKVRVGVGVGVGTSRPNSSTPAWRFSSPP